MRTSVPVRPLTILTHMGTEEDAALAEGNRGWNAEIEGFAGSFRWGRTRLDAIQQATAAALHSLAYEVEMGKRPIIDNPIHFETKEGIAAFPRMELVIYNDKET